MPVRATLPQGPLTQADVPALPESVADHTFIYELLCPLTRLPRYVGKANSPAVRLGQHFYSRKHKSNPASRWQADLWERDGLRAVMRILEGPVPYSERVDAEQRWIDRHRANGHDLLNVNAGGGGSHDGHTHWTADRCRDAVLALTTACGGMYPTKAQFEAAGMAGLYQAVRRRMGGHRTFAARLGLAMHTPTPRDWTSRPSAVAAVRRVARQHRLGSRYPSRRQFEAAGMTDLYRAISNWDGGHQALAHELGWAYGRHDWSDPQRMADTVMELALDGAYPTPRRFAAAGLDGLYQAISRREGGHGEMARSLGLTQNRRTWESRAVRHKAVRELASNLDSGRYPIQLDFRDAGLWGLYQAIDRQEGHAWHARELGLAMARASWGDPQGRAGAVAELARRLEHGRYPSHDEFRDAGLSGLQYRIAHSRGGHEAMARRLGLRRKRGAVRARVPA